MRKGNLVRIIPGACEGKLRLRTSYVGQSAMPDGKVQDILFGRWESPVSKWDSADWIEIPLTSTVYLLEAARVVARNIDSDYRHGRMAIIKDIGSGQSCYIERELLEAVNTSKKFRLRECVVRNKWVLEKAK